MIVSQYALDDERLIIVDRVGFLREDKWAVRWGRRRLGREALEWRASNPCADVCACPAWSWEMQPSDRTDGWKQQHTFTLAEARSVCGLGPTP